MRTLKNFDFKEKRVLVRCDFNVPLDDKGNILDDFRIKETIPTIEYLMKEGAKIILMTHIGRPGGKIVESLRVTPVRDRLMEYLNSSSSASRIYKTSDCIGEEIEKRICEMQPGEILLLENLKFHIGEEKNDDRFAKELSKLGDIYINDAFGTCHQPYASIIGVPKYLPSGAGFLLEKEIKILTILRENPRKPEIAIIGGVKVETKAKFIDKISENADFVLIGGLIEKEIREKKVRFKNPEKIIGPVDPADALDIGPKTIARFKEKIALAKTIFWSGPLGKIEEKPFQKGSKAVARAIIESGAVSVVGGGETVEFINKMGLTEKFTHVSTGGGAMFDFVVNGKSVGIAALK